jgi:hypothetical protein
LIQRGVDLRKLKVRGSRVLEILVRSSAQGAEGVKLILEKHTDFIQYHSSPAAQLLPGRLLFEALMFGYRDTVDGIFEVIRSKTNIINLGETIYN